MSNIIRNQQPGPVEKKILQTRKIEYQQKKSVSLAKDVNPAEEKLRLMQEIETLETRYEELKTRLNHEEQSAKAEIEQWWTSKRQEAEEEAQKLADQAVSEGYQAGVEQGALRIEEEFKQKRLEMNELVETAYIEKGKIIQEAETFLLSLSIKVAKKIIKDELKTHEEQLINVVKQALKHVEETEDIVLQVSAEDYPVLLPFLEELKTYIRADFDLKLIPVASLDQGDCILDTASGSYDVTVDSQLEEIKKHLLAYCEEKVNDEPA